MNLLIKSACHYAEQAHNNQKRKGTNTDYIEHPLAVAWIISQYTNNPDIIIAALLHDVVEDTNITVHDVALTFNTIVAARFE